MVLQVGFRSSATKKSSNSGDPTDKDDAPTTIAFLSSDKYDRSSHLFCSSSIPNSEGKSKIKSKKIKRPGKRWMGRLGGSMDGGWARVMMCSASPALYLTKKARELRIWRPSLGRGNDGGDNARVEPYFSVPVVVPPPTSI